MDFKSRALIARALVQHGYHWLVLPGGKGRLVREEGSLGYLVDNAILDAKKFIYNYFLDENGEPSVPVSLQDIREIISQVSADPAARLMPNELNKKPFRILFENGAYLADEGKFYALYLYEFGKDALYVDQENKKKLFDYSFIKIPHKYDPNAEPSPEMFDFLGKIFPDAETRQRWWEWLGYCLTTDVTSAKKAMFFLGPQHSGKSTLARVMEAIVGPENWREKSIHDLLDSRWGMADIIGKLVSYDDDCGTQTIYKQQTLKTLTGHNVLDVEQKGVQPYQACHTAKILVCGNARPKIKNLQESTASRWLECEFQWEFLPENEYNYRTDGGKKKVERIEIWNPGILDILRDPANLAGCINVALGYLKELIDRRFSFTGLTAEQMQTKWRAETDPVFGFLQDACVRDAPPGECSLCDDVYQAFTRWCEDWGWESHTKSAFSRSLGAAGHPPQNTRRGGRQVRIYKNLRLRDEVVEISENIEDLVERLDFNDLR